MKVRGGYWKNEITGGFQSFLTPVCVKSVRSFPNVSTDYMNGLRSFSCRLTF